MIFEQFLDPFAYCVSSHLIRTTIMTENLCDRIIRFKIIIVEERRLTAFLPFPPSSAFPESTKCVGLLGRRDGIVAWQKPTSSTIGFLIFSALLRSSIPLVLKTKERTRRFLDHDTSSILNFCVSTELLRIRYSSLGTKKSSVPVTKRGEKNKTYLPCSNAPL